MALFGRIIARRSLLAVNGLVNRCISHDVTKSSSTNTDTKHKTNGEIAELKGKPWLIFASPVDTSLVCSVSADFEMHRGIARDFKKTFGKVDELKEQKKSVGEVAVLKRNDHNSFVYHLLVRERWWDQASKETYHSSITAMKEHCIDNGITELAVPRLGTGDDGMNWDVIKEILDQVFDGTGITIKAYTTR
ncbi:ADP-ribose glycohydrolase OARD1 [Exaiptasia diaphana]|uniref:Macro domain-containing protein n=1 Tax=Exaiptasia diaphana TaxID=2652724 RepID=A0A913XUE4_EXADI|nr:ADP-ribose glycohydrolase OARD1 [Exaiptasia diaphana]KXJ09089.1 O-acetyl-ADP-ribose deacetylase 1 [Exaiptasia diaphana]